MNSLEKNYLKIPLEFAYEQMDEWQIKLLEAIGHIILLCGRQVGKSEIIAYIEARYLLNTPNAKLLIVSGVERQASGLYNKILNYIEGQHPEMLKTGKDKPLRTEFYLTNGACCITEPLGNYGAGARQHTISRIVFEEMQLIPEEAFAAITPMLLTTGGDIHMLGTAWDTEGYVYERLADKDFTVVRVNAEEVAEKRPEPQRKIMLQFLESERHRLSEAIYAQEYLAIPSAKTRQIFSDQLIARVMIANRRNINLYNEHIIGVDPAGLGEDEGSMSIFEDTEDNFIQCDQIITRKQHTTQTTEKIIMLDEQYGFNKIYLDDGGVGFGVFSELLHDERTKRKVVALNNASRPIDADGKKTTHILGEEMIFHLLTMMERGIIQMLPDAEIRESLKSYRFEYDKNTHKLHISSTYNHPVQSIMRAAWHKQRKSLNLRVYSIKV